LISHAFFPRRETGSVNNNEVMFLQQGLVPVIKQSRGRDYLFPTTEELQPSTQRVFLRVLLDIHNWAGHRTDSTLKLSIGGWVTLILKLMRVPLRNKFENARLMDIPYLAKVVILVGEWEGRYGKSFQYNESPCIVLIPNEECTIFEYNNAIDFRTLSQFFHDPIQQPLT
ncbi:unnamed protein product, partial [Cochlearia groenlandica]